MHYRLRVPLLALAWLLAVSLLPAALHAQQIILPLPADPARAAHAAPAANAARGEARTTALALPFFEDFAGQPEGLPDPSRWKDGKVLVNERFSNAPPTRGMATFDGLDSLGRAYGPSNLFGPTDVLTSQAIDLSGVQPGQSTYLSFFWQTGSVVGGPYAEQPNRQVRLELEFLDNTGAWNRVWYTPSVDYGTGNQSVTRTRFRQRYIAVNDARYMHAGFRFRFRSYGSLYGTHDSWNLDYLILDRNRDTTRNRYADLALSAPLSSLLKRYTAMPARQFNAAPNPAQELNDSTFTTFNSLDTLTLATPYTYQGDVRVLPNGPASQFVTGSALAQPGIKQVYTGGSLRGAPLSIPSAVGTTTRVQHSIYLSLVASPLPRTALNDTVRRVTEFADYFAYDDGTAEGTTIVNPSNNSLPVARAIRFNLNAPDQVSKIRYYYAGATAPTGGTLPASVTVTFNIWPVGPDGKPEANPIASVSQTLPTSVAAGGFREAIFPQAVPVGGSFFIGYVQAATTPQFIQFGADLNSRQHPNTFYDRRDNVWGAFTRPGLVPLIRPVMTGQVTSAHSAAADAAVQVYPNPSSGLVQVQGRYARAVVLDALGRTAWTQPAAQAGQAQLDLRGLPAGVYLLRLTLPDGAVGTKRLVLQP